MDLATILRWLKVWKWPEYFMVLWKAWHEKQEAKYKAKKAKTELTQLERESEIERIYGDIESHYFREVGIVRPMSPPKASPGEKQELVDEAWRRYQKNHPI